MGDLSCAVLAKSKSGVRTASVLGLELTLAHFLQELCSACVFESASLLVFQDEGVPVAMCPWPADSEDVWAGLRTIPAHEARELVSRSDGGRSCSVGDVGPERTPMSIAALRLVCDHPPEAVLCVRQTAPGPLALTQNALARLAQACGEAFSRFRMCEAAGVMGHEIDFVGVSDVFRRMEARIAQAAHHDWPVLIMGERGVGKEAVAYGIHYYSSRRDHGFLTVNSALLPNELAASELFGFRQGAFTGATRARPGKFQAADRGTVFLDEIGEAPLAVLGGLLRVLEYGEVQRLGDDFPTIVDVRVVASTNRDLPAMVRAGKFPPDVFDRLNVFSIRVPALRDRREDLPLLITYLFHRLVGQGWSGAPAGGLTESARASVIGTSEQVVLSSVMSIAKRYDFPGNIRELRNFVLRLAAYGPGWQEALPSAAGGSGGTDLRLRTATRRHILSVLEMAGWNKSATARTLDVPLSTLVSKMRKLGIDSSRGREDNNEDGELPRGGASEGAEDPTEFPRPGRRIEHV